MNATLQCLCHIDSIKNYFLNDDLYNQDIITKPNSLTKYFTDVLRKLWSKTYENSYAPKEFKNKIIKMNPLFQGIQPNEPQDLLLFLYGSIHNELNNPSQNPDQIKMINLINAPNDLILFRKNYYSQNYSIISKTFYYEQSNVIECHNCHYKTYNFNIMNVIIFSLEEVILYLTKRNPKGFSSITLYDCFEQNQEKEMLEGSNQIYCNQCHQNTNASSYSHFYTCPEVLTIILNYNECDVNFSFPMELTLEKYVQDKSYDPIYELISILSLKMSSIKVGDIVAYCRSPIDDKWYLYNDSQVTPCSRNIIDELHSNNIPYILFYQRRNIHT